MNTHNIISAVYTTASTDPGAPVQATRANGTVETRRNDDDIDGGGMRAFLAGGGVIAPYVAPVVVLTADDVRDEAQRAERATSVEESSRCVVSTCCATICNRACRFIL